MNYKDRMRRYNEDRKRRNRQDPGSAAITDPTNPASVMYQTQTNHFYPDGSYISESSDSGYASRSDASRDISSSSYDSGSSSDSGSSGGGYSGE